MSEKTTQELDMDETLNQALLDNFGFNAFKGNQKDIIGSILNKADTLVIMPTGGGKSLCYQLPAIMQEGTALIISPLIALMKNQVDLMRGYSSNDNIAHFLNSSLSRTQIKQVKTDLIDGHTKMLYVAPETLTKDETVAFLKQLDISFVAVDEAHCISEWGHDFRPEYRRIRAIVDAIDPELPIVALTATATPKVQDDILKNLQLRAPNIYIDSFNRPNLYYEIRPKGKPDVVIKQIIQFIKQNTGKSGIIYCLNRKTTEDIAEMLLANDIKAAAYHAGLEPHVRTERQDQFLSEEIDIIVATIAFGMGIDKPDVRYVIHYNMPKSLENYYQETGRAGRDGLEGRCVGFFNHVDMSKLEKFMRDKPVAEREVGGQHLSEVISYCESATCRREFLLHYFGEPYNEPNCCNCDNCLQPKEKIDLTNSAILAINAILGLKENFNAKYICTFLLGEETQEIIDFEHDQLEYFGEGDEQNRNYWNTVINQILLEDLLRKDIENYGILKVQEAGLEYIKKPYPLLRALNHEYDEVSATIEAETPQMTTLDQTLFNTLRDLRKRVAKVKKVPPYVVFQDRSLEEMATFYPITLEELENINGVSKGKAEKFGKEFIKLITDYVEQNEIERAMDLVMKSVANKSKAKIEIIKQIDKKIPLATIGKNLDLKPNELLAELEKIVDAGTKLNIDYHINNILDRDEQEEIFEYLMTAETDSVSDAARELGTDIYDEDDIRYVRIQFMSKMAH
ncbi:MAG: DNA helicase RecQ [Chitinophagales bacterium]|nr:DNA helicase RecQ [Chitinophagales bacterium]